MTWADDVREFMLAAEQTVRDEPTVIDDVEKWQRFDYLNEEFSEMKRALVKLKKATEYHDQSAVEDAMAELFDAFIDMSYIGIGTCHAYGFPVDEGWRRVHEANMAKVNPETGKIDRDENNKGIKPEGWQPPDIRGLLYPERN